MRVAKLVIDTNVFVAARDPGEAGHSPCRRLLNAVDEDRIQGLVSVITLAELRCGFTVAQVPALWTPFLSHVRASQAYSIEPVDEAIALTAGEIRSAHGLTLPDALILATATCRGADCVVTEDRELLRARSGTATKRPSDIQFGTAVARPD
ncbi:MAG: PIN domain-containing protein [Thermoplasmata archaeon]|nr:PIN domain-containing protein [Thermoplasmata archaeon]